MAKDDEVKIIIKQKGTIPVYTSTRYGTGEVIHDETLEGKGTSNSPLKISDEILQEIEDAGKVDDVYVNGVSVLAADKIAYVVVPTKVSDLNNDLDFQTLTQVSNAISAHNESSTAHADIRQDIANVSDSIATSIATHNTSDSAHQDIRNLISDLSEWTTESYTATTTNFVVGQTYTIDGAFQRTAALFAGAFDEISTINSKIPAQATTQNQLADKNFVNATIATNSANFRGNWATWEYVPTQADQYPEDYVGSRTPTNNDYMVVSDASDYISSELSPIIHVETVSTDGNDAVIKITDLLTANVYEFHHRTTQTKTQIGETGFYVRYITPMWHITSDIPFTVDGIAYLVGSEWTWNYGIVIDKTAEGYPVYSGTWRFIYVGTWATDGKSGWHPTYQIGTAFTQEQQAAIDSGITKNMVDNYVNPTSTANTAYNKRITALETDKRDIINSANKVYATDATGANKNDLVYTTAATADTIAQRGTNGVLKVGTPTEDADATTKLYVDTMASTKQNTLTAGTNISIVNDVISATAQESFFRGKFLTWSDVPTSDSGYTPDYSGSRTPTENDYMVVEDSSGYVKVGAAIDIYREPQDPQTGTYGARFVCEYFDTTVRHSVGSGGIIIGTQGNRLKITYASYTWSVIPLDTPLIVDGVEKPVNEVAYSFYYLPANGELVKTINYASSGTYEGTWRFAYHGTWSVEGKNGWVAEYQVEDVLPTADSSTAGIAKLYTTTGQNTDGSMTQASVTTALGGKQDTLTNASNAGEGIIIDDVTQEISTNNIIWRKW